jgi:hypothetical protein
MIIIAGKHLEGIGSELFEDTITEILKRVRLKVRTKLSLCLTKYHAMKTYLLFN